MDGYFGGKYGRVYEGEAYADVIRRIRLERLKNTQKAIGETTNIIRASKLAKVGQDDQ